MTLVMDAWDFNDELADADFQIMERTGSNAVAKPADDFPLPCDQFAAYRRLNMLKNSFKASGYEVRDSDIRAEHETMNTGFVVTYLGKFVAAYEIVQVGE